MWILAIKFAHKIFEPREFIESTSLINQQMMSVCETEPKRIHSRAGDTFKGIEAEFPTTSTIQFKELGALNV